MPKKRIAIILLIISIFTTAPPAKALSGKGLVQLKKAGVSDRTIGLIVKEKVIETAAFTVDEIVSIKKAGISEQTLRLLIKEGSFLKNSQPLVYGQNSRPIRFTSAQDIIALKNAGLSDEVIQAVIAVTGERYYSEREEAYDLLRDMEIEVDTRRRGGDPD